MTERHVSIPVLNKRQYISTFVIIDHIRKELIIRNREIHTEMVASKVQYI